MVHPQWLSLSSELWIVIWTFLPTLYGNYASLTCTHFREHWLKMIKLHRASADQHPLQYCQLIWRATTFNADFRSWTLDYVLSVVYPHTTYPMKPLHHIIVLIWRNFGINDGYGWGDNRYPTLDGNIEWEKLRLRLPQALPLIRHLFANSAAYLNTVKLTNDKVGCTRDKQLTYLRNLNNSAWQRMIHARQFELLREEFDRIRWRADKIYFLHNST